MKLSSWRRQGFWMSAIVMLCMEALGDFLLWQPCPNHTPQEMIFAGIFMWTLSLIFWPLILLNWLEGRRDFRNEAKP
jgi:hypothetical protein